MTNATYQVNETGFNSFMAAVRFAQSVGSVVIETATGNRRWSPAAPVSAKKMRQHREHQNAYAAQCRMNQAA